MITSNDNRPDIIPLIGLVRDDGRVERLKVVRLLRIPAHVLALFRR